MNAAEKIALATKRLRETRSMAARLPDGDAKARAMREIDRIATELASGVARAMRPK